MARIPAISTSMSIAGEEVVAGYAILVEEGRKWFGRILITS